MAEPHDLLKARRESAALLNLGDVERLSPADALRCDLISTLRLAIDGEQATVLDGGSADLAKLITATENLIRLLPGRELPAPEANQPDPRETMWQIYKQMRERGELSLRGELPDEGPLQAKISEQSAEIERLRAQLAGKPLAITPREADITPPSELGRCSTGRIVGPDDPKPPVTIEAKAAKRSNPQPASWDDSAGGKAWRSWVDSGGAHYDRWGNHNE